MGEALILVSGGREDCLWGRMQAFVRDGGALWDVWQMLGQRRGE